MIQTKHVQKCPCSPSSAFKHMHPDLELQIPRTVSIILPSSCDCNLRMLGKMSMFGNGPTPSPFLCKHVLVLHVKFLYLFHQGTHGLGGDAVICGRWWSFLHSFIAWLCLLVHTQPRTESIHCVPLHEPWATPEILNISCSNHHRGSWPCRNAKWI